ncbi:MAG: tRNA dihydrouridine(20/20a) synthase DusA [bacterium]
MQTNARLPHIPYSVAPMMDWSDRHYRYFMRGITRDALLYTEMISTAAIVHGDRAWLLDFDPVERPLALQLGGSDPEEIARAVAAAEPWDYDEVNLNVGCPSDRVQERGLGACLMASPDLVARIVEAMRRNTGKPVTVKHRIGIDHLDRYEDMYNFVKRVREAGPERFTVHARIAWLEGLSPKENRTVPPLRYEDVYRLKNDFPDLDIEINGGIRSLDAAEAHLVHVDRVMIGRAAYETPWVMSGVDPRTSGAPCPSEHRRAAAERMIPYLERWHAQGTPSRKILRHMLGLFSGMPGARRWRQGLSGKLPENAAPRLRHVVESMPTDALEASPG